MKLNHPFFDVEDEVIEFFVIVENCIVVIINNYFFFLPPLLLKVLVELSLVRFSIYGLFTVVVNY